MMNLSNADWEALDDLLDSKIREPLIRILVTLERIAERLDETADADTKWRTEARERATQIETIATEMLDQEGEGDEWKHGHEDDGN